MTNEPTFGVWIGGVSRLAISDIWPDGGAPENPTREDVAEVMRKCGSQWQVMGDWNMNIDLAACVDGLKVWE